MSRLAPAPLMPSPAARARPRWWREVILLGVLYLMYDGIRLLVAAGHGEAFTNAHRVLDLETALRIKDEIGVNHAVSAVPAVAVPLSYAYATLHYIVTSIVLVWLWKCRPHRYRGARTALVIATLIGLLGFWFFPTAPPRMMPGFVDTLARYHDWGWWGEAASAPKGMAGLTNEFAAMPSLHVGWAAWCGWQIARSTTRRWLQVLGALYPFFMFVVVVGTANHYIADAVAGLAVIGAGALVARFREQVRGPGSRPLAGAERSGARRRPGADGPAGDYASG
jgi:PAP2 superfamily protein